VQKNFFGGGEAPGIIKVNIHIILSDWCKKNFFGGGGVGGAKPPGMIKVNIHIILSDKTKEPMMNLYKEIHAGYKGGV
jgi:hypothetical protein